MILLNRSAIRMQDQTEDDASQDCETYSPLPIGSVLLGLESLLCWQLSSAGAVLLREGGRDRPQRYDFCPRCGYTLVDAENMVALAALASSATLFIFVIPRSLRLSL